MTPFEFGMRGRWPFEHPLHQHVQRILRRAARTYSHTPRLLDVGGRRSNYTIGVPAEVWLSDIPREKEIQRDSTSARQTRFARKYWGAEATFMHTFTMT